MILLNLNQFAQDLIFQQLTALYYLRYFIIFSYFGKSFYGWQRQPNAITVQQLMEEALSVLVRKPVVLVAAGRTDAGVHAKQMYAHFNLENLKDMGDLKFRMNSFLPSAIAIHNIFKVPNDAHARFDAVERTYEYWVVQEKNPFYMESAFYVMNRLDIDKMNEAAALLLYYKDFECFSKSNTDVRTYLCSIKVAFWEQKEDVLVFTITANRFLRNMVRTIVGTLLDVGLGKSDLANFIAIIESKDRSEAGTSVPAKGLYLTRVLYPENIEGLNE